MPSMRRKGPMTAHIVIDVSEEDLKNILITAVESAIGYWAESKNYNWKKGTVTVREHNDERDEKKRGPWVRVTTKTIAQGLQLCSKMPADEGGWAFAMWLKDRIGDATTADNIFQFGVLKELKYG